MFRREYRRAAHAIVHFVYACVYAYTNANDFSDGKGIGYTEEQADEFVDRLVGPEHIIAYLDKVMVELSMFFLL